MFLFFLPANLKQWFESDRIESLIHVAAPRPHVVTRRLFVLWISLVGESMLAFLLSFFLPTVDHILIEAKVSCHLSKQLHSSRLSCLLYRLRFTDLY